MFLRDITIAFPFLCLEILILVGRILTHMAINFLSFPFGWIFALAIEVKSVQSRLYA